MFRFLKEFFALLTPAQRKRLLRLQGLVVCMAFAEVVGIMSMGPFMAVVSNMDRLKGHGRLAQIYQWTGVSSPQSFLIIMGVVVLCLLLIAAMFSMFALWRLFTYGATIGAELSERLFDHYLHQPWLFHSSGSSSNLTKQIAQETYRVTNSIILPLMQMNAKLTVAFFILAAVFVYNPPVAVVGAAIFASAYYILYQTVRRKLTSNGEAISLSQGQRYKLMSEGFGGIKDVLLLGRQQIFSERFHNANRTFAHAMALTQTLSQAPRYAIEAVAYGSVISLVLYLLAAYDGNAEAILSTLAVYAMAGFKMMPALQSSYQLTSEIRGNVAALDAIREDLRKSAESAVKERASTAAQQAGATTTMLDIKRDIRLDNVTFTYPGKVVPALAGIDLTIPRKQVIGLVGATGSGKSTAIDMLLGLITPDTGDLQIDGNNIDGNNLRTWQNTVGYVPQSIFLADATIRENIAFGLSPSRIDENKVKRAARLAHLDEMLSDLSGGLDTRVGERGVQLSGGQRQRIGIARALYNDADVLILDEATSALDGITEKLIMEAIHDFSGKKTIVMIAHRLSTVRRCDCIYLMREGRIIDSGSYDQLNSGNLVFREMAAHS
jgi:ABC-type multidrug transport system fused ATPase/permease subunit